MLENDFLWKTAVFVWDVVRMPFRSEDMTEFRSQHRPGDLDLWPLTLNLERITACRVNNLPINFGLRRTFRSRLIGQHLSDASRGLATLTFDLEGHGACRWCGSSWSVSVQSLKFVGLPVRKIWRTSGLSISRPGDPDLWPWIWGALLVVGWTIFLPILVFLRLCVLDLWANTCQADDVTLRPWPLTLEVMAIQVFVLPLYTTFEVRRPSHSKDIAHLLC